MNIKGMTPQIHGQNIELNARHIAYITKKLAVVEKIYQHILFAKIDIISNTHHKKGKIILVKAELVIPRKPIILAEEEVTTVEEGIDRVTDELKLQLRKLKEKQRQKRERLS